MQIYIKHLNGSKITTADVTLSDTVPQLGRTIEDMIGIMLQRLVYNRKSLDLNDSSVTMKQLGVHEESVFLFSPRPPPGTVHISYILVF